MSQSLRHATPPILPSPIRVELSAQNPPPAPKTDHLERVSYLFGYPIAHSLSPLLHGTIYEALGLKYQQYLYETPSLESCLSLTQDPKFFGASVTMPFKVAIIPHLDVLTPEGEAIGAINTIFLRSHPSGRRLLCGTNTDCIGIREAILQNSPRGLAETWKGRPGMVVGGGGTCRAAVYALKHFLGCSEIYLVNRDRAECELVIAECKSKGFGDGLKYVASVAEAEKLEKPVVGVSAIPDFLPKTREEVEARAVVDTFLSAPATERQQGVILEMCYHPSPDTGMARLAKSKRWQVVEGVEAMIWQGLEQDKVWLRRKVSTMPVEKVKKVVLGKLAQNKL